MARKSSTTTDSGSTWSDRAEDAITGVRALSRGMDAYRRAWAVRLELGSAELVALGELMHEPRMRVGDLAVRTGLTPGSVTSLVDRLERRDLVARSRPPGNRRVVQLDLTDAGRALTHEVFSPLGGVLDEALADRDADAAAVLVRTVHDIAELMERAAARVGAG